MSELSDLPPISKKQIKSISKILTGIKKEDGTDLVTKEQADTLAALRFKESGEQILTLEDRNFLYEIIWLLQSEKVGYEGVYNFLTTNWEKVLGKHNIRKKMLFENPLMSKEREKFLLDMEIYRNKVDVEEGGIDCPRCKSSSTISREKQTRSADEAMSIYVTCIDCKYRWQVQ